MLEFSFFVVIFQFFKLQLIDKVRWKKNCICVWRWKSIKLIHTQCEEGWWGDYGFLYGIVMCAQLKKNRKTCVAIDFRRLKWNGLYLIISYSLYEPYDGLLYTLLCRSNVIVLLLLCHDTDDDIFSLSLSKLLCCFIRTIFHNTKKMHSSRVEINTFLSD